MDPFFDNFLGYKQFGPAFERREVPATSLTKFQGKLPNQLLAYWAEFGWCGYAQGLFWTVDPDEWDEELEAWVGDSEFMERDAYHVIARSAFGELFLWGERTGQSLKVLAPYGMLFPSFDPDGFERRGADRSLQLFFSGSSRDALDLKDEEGQPLFERALAKLGPLDHNTMYGFVPALALGAAPRLENLQIVDAHIHMDILAQASERRVMLDIAKEGRERGLI